MVEPKRPVMSDQDIVETEPSLAGPLGCLFLVVALSSVVVWLVFDSIRRDEINQRNAHQDHQRMVQMFHDLQEQKRLFHEQKKSSKPSKSIKKVPQK